MPPLTLDWLRVIILLGAVQGGILAVALTARKQNRTANRLLATLMFCFAIYLASSVYHAASLFEAYPWFFGWGYPMPFIFGPLVYLYAVAAADRSRRMRPVDWIHLVPFAVVAISAFPIYMKGGPEKLEIIRNLLAGDSTPFMNVERPFRYISGLGYGAATLLFLRRHSREVEHGYSTTERVNLRWVFWFGVSAAAIWVLATALNVLDVPRADDFISLAVAILVCTVGFMGLRQPEILRFETAEFPIPRMPAPAPTPARTPTPIPERAVSYERSGLSPAEAKRLKERLVASMEKDAPWKDSELTLADLAEGLGTTPHKLSEVLNAEVGETFYDFVNGYRVRDVQRRITAGEAKSRKMLALALDAGFASKSTFNQVFKKHTGTTPSGFGQGLNV